MKRLISFFLILVAIVPIFATNEYLDLKNAEMERISALEDGFGNAYFSSNGDIYRTPSFLARKGLTLSVPYFSARLLNAVNTLGSFDKILNEPTIAGHLVYDSYSRVGDLNLGLGFTLGGFGFTIDAKDSMYTYLEPNSNVMESALLMNRSDIALLLGYGKRFYSSHVYLDLGISTGLNLTAYNKALLLSELYTNKGIEHLWSKTEVYSSYSIPLSTSLDLSFPIGLMISASIRNPALFSNGNIVDSFTSLTAGSFFMSSSDSNFGMNSRFIVDCGISYGYKKDFIARVECDFVDISRFAERVNRENFGFALLEHIRAGVEFGYKWVAIRGGFNGKSWSAGLTANVKAFSIDLAYAKTMASIYTGKETDILTVTMNVGWK